MTQTLILIKIICYLLSIFLILGSCLVISSYKLIYSIFSLVLVFFCGIWFFVIYDAEYALFIFLVVYLGAIVIFFIFVIMLLNPTINKHRNNLTDTQILLVLSLTCILIVFLLFLVKNSFDFGSEISLSSPILDIENIYPLYFTNIEKIGLILYTDFGILLVLVGFLLFVSILGCVLILKPVRKKPGSL